MFTDADSKTFGSKEEIGHAGTEVIHVRMVFSVQDRQLISVASCANELLMCAIV